jgi:hypothetical protein
MFNTCLGAFYGILIYIYSRRLRTLKREALLVFSSVTCLEHGLSGKGDKILKKSAKISNL